MYRSTHTHEGKTLTLAQRKQLLVIACELDRVQLKLASEQPLGWGLGAKPRQGGWWSVLSQIDIGLIVDSIEPFLPRKLRFVVAFFKVAGGVLYRPTAGGAADSTI